MYSAYLFNNLWLSISQRCNTVIQSAVLTIYPSKILNTPDLSGKLLYVIEKAARISGSSSRSALAFSPPHAPTAAGPLPSGTPVLPAPRVSRAEFQGLPRLGIKLVARRRAQDQQQGGFGHGKILT